MYLEDELLERALVAENIHKILNRLSTEKSTLLKVKMLLTDIARNRTRVKDIMNRFHQTDDDRKARVWILAQLAK